MKRLMIIGATSAIALETARIFAARSSILYLVARNGEKLAIICDDLKLRGAVEVYSKVLDINETGQHPALIEEAKEAMQKLDGVLIAHGTLSDQAECQTSYELTYRELTTNCLSVISLLTVIANIFEQQKSGTIAVISSVAGDRGRQSNYVYGTAKAAVSTFMQGLRSRLYSSNVQVVTIKPGFVDTPMTKDFDKGLLWIGPKTVARGVVLAMKRGSGVVYLPWFWRYIMLIIRAIPEGIFKKLSI